MSKNNNRRIRKEEDGVGFEITQERIEVINKATEYMNKMGDFAELRNKIEAIEIIKNKKNKKIESVTNLLD